jgi:mannose-6-phosphate isomerase
MASLKPCLLERITQTKVWGGTGLTELFGIRGEGPEPVGETWELFDRPDGCSKIRGGGTVREWMESDAKALLGERVKPGFGGYFPLLFKFLDAQQPLSVQVHPDDAQAAAENDSGKSEAWLVLKAAPDAQIIRGFQPGVTREQFAANASTEAIEPLLYSFVPKVDDVINVPANTVHAVGAGCVIFEVQQNSDITYRIYDWGRKRKMHLEQAMRVSRIDDGSVQPTVTKVPLPDGSVQLIKTPYFRIRRHKVQRPLTVPTQGAFLVVTVLGGRGTLGWRSGGDDAPLPLGPGDCALVPACTAEIYLSPIGSLDVALTDPGLD